MCLLVKLFGRREQNDALVQLVPGPKNGTDSPCIKVVNLREGTRCLTLIENRSRFISSSVYPFCRVARNSFCREDSWYVEP